MVQTNSVLSSGTVIGLVSTRDDSESERVSVRDESESERVSVRDESQGEDERQG
jgi:hypothetical protein